MLILRFLCLTWTCVALGACAHKPPKEPKPPTDAQQVGMKEKPYRKLVEKAHAGDRDAAEELSRMWYFYTQDNAKALYWLEVAAQNGSKKAEQLSLAARRL